MLGVDRILDMYRTTVNVTADLTTAIYVARSESGASAPTTNVEEKPPTE